MAYGLSTRALIDDGPVEQVARTTAVRPSGLKWQTLSDVNRLEAVEQALRAANDRIDGYPLAL